MSEEIGLTGDVRQVTEAARILEERSFRIAGRFIAETEAIDAIAVTSLSELIEEAELVVAFIANDNEALQWLSGSHLLSDDAANKLLIVWGTVAAETRKRLESTANRVGASLVFVESETMRSFRSPITCLGQRGAIRRAEPVLELLSSEIRYI